MSLCKRMWLAPASAQFPHAALSTIDLTSSGAMFDNTLTTPHPPIDISGSVSESSPERIGIGHSSRILLAMSSDPVASLIQRWVAAAAGPAPGVLAAAVHICGKIHVPDRVPGGGTARGRARWGARGGAREMGAGACSLCSLCSCCGGCCCCCCFDSPSASACAGTAACGRGRLRHLSASRFPALELHFGGTRLPGGSCGATRRARARLTAATIGRAATCRGGHCAGCRCGAVRRTGRPRSARRRRHGPRETTRMIGGGAVVAAAAVRPGSWAPAAGRRLRRRREGCL